MKLDGIHHVTAITGDAPRNVDFYTRVLGLRLTAKTVNQDDPSVYHLFYGDELARPGADLTFFEYPGALPGRAGARHGPPRRLARRVRAGAGLLGRSPGRRGRGRRARRRRPAVRRLRGTRRTSSWSTRAATRRSIADHPEIPGELALQGFEGVRAYSHRAGAPRRAARAADGRAAPRRGAFELRGAPRGGWIALDEPPAERGRQSAGTVHHVAWGDHRRRAGSVADRLNKARACQQRDHRPALLPLAVLPRARRRAVRARDRGAGLHGRRPGRGARPADHPAAVARAAARRGRGAPDSAAGPARRLGAHPDLDSPGSWPTFRTTRATRTPNLPGTRTRSNARLTTTPPGSRAWSTSVISSAASITSSVA